MRALIMVGLALPTAPYCTACPEQNLSKIISTSGQNAGLSTFVDEMATQLASHGTRVSIRTSSEVTQLIPPQPSNGSGLFVLRHTGGPPVAAKRVILNLPTQPLLTLLRNSPAMTAAARSAPENELVALRHSRGADALKLYVHYEDAWWRNVLNLTVGYFNNSYTPACTTSGTSVPQYAPLSGRYHDGHVECDQRGLMQGEARGACRGFLEAAYAYDEVAIAHYRPYLADADTSFAVLRYADGWEAQALLDEVHAALVALHADRLAAAGALERVRSLRPSLGVLSIFDRLSRGFGAGIHDWMRDASPGASCASFSACQRVMPPRVLQPFGTEQKVYVVNEAYGSRSGWCEGSLVMAENVVATHFGLPRPGWIDADIYEQHVIFNVSSAELQLSAARPEFRHVGYT